MADKIDMETAEKTVELCSDVQDKLDNLEKKGYCGMLIIKAPDDRRFVAEAGSAGELLKLIGNAAVPSLVYDDYCSKADAGEFLRDTTAVVTHHFEEE